ncbi:MAG: endolytic transglycosylase MltG [Thermodesulfobacteriota bacterium]
MSKRLEKGLLFLVILFILLTTHLYITFYGPAARVKSLVTIRVARGAPFIQVAEELRSAGVIASKGRFLFAARLMGAFKDTKAGEYELSPSMTPVTIIHILTRGEVKQYTVTIPEGYSVSDIAEVLSKKGLVRSDVFMARAWDANLVKKLKLPGPTFEGYLFPDTYRLRKNMSAEEIIEVMVRRFKEVYKKEFKRLARKRKLDMRSTVTLASIIEKETNTPSERPLISSVFHNRLRKKIKLQSDPTVIYAIRTVFNGNIRKKDLKVDSPYNTYIHYGLPPGPIANPGREAISAALSPAETKYLYFVSKNNGTHYFSSSYREHINAVNRYQKRRRGRARPR